MEGSMTKESFVAIEYMNELRELSKYDCDVLMPRIAMILRSRVGEKARITNVDMRALLRAEGIKAGDGKIREMIRLIRVSGQVKYLCAGKGGYYVAKDLGEFKRYMLSNFYPRWRKILVVYIALKSQLEEMGGGDAGGGLMELTEWADAEEVF